MFFQHSTAFDPINVIHVSSRDERSHFVHDLHPFGYHTCGSKPPITVWTVNFCLLLAQCRRRVLISGRFLSEAVSRFRPAVTLYRVRCPAQSVNNWSGQIDTRQHYMISTLRFFSITFSHGFNRASKSRCGQTPVFENYPVSSPVDRKSAVMV